MTKKKPLLLLVDDVDLFLELERSYLEGSGYRMEVARSGQDALRRMEELRPDLLLLDLYLPDLNGDLICQKLRADEKYRRLPIIMITSAGRTEEMDRCRKAGCDAVLTKPVDRQTLRQTVRDLLDRDNAAPADPSAAEVAAPAAADPGARPGKAEALARQLKKENAQLHKRVNELERENSEFAAQMLQAESYSSTLSNLYVASSRLHATLDRQEVLEIIRDVVINLVGAEVFALLSCDPEKHSFTFELGEGLAADPFPPVVAGQGVLGRVLEQPEVQVLEQAPGTDIDLTRPLVVIPLRLRAQVTGVIAIYRLLEHKNHFEEVDHQLFGLLAEQAATALFSSTLYTRAQRRQQTYKDVVELLLS